MTIEVLISPSPHVSAPLRKQIRVAIRMIAKDFGWDAGQLSIAILDDASIQEINRKYLSHDYPTDVISFDLTDSDRRINGESRLEGEILVSWETAARVALEQGCRLHRKFSCTSSMGCYTSWDSTTTPPTNASKCADKNVITCER
jgi:rRNA maturation RNase YbeY